MLKYKVTTEPTFEPITVSEAKKHCRVLDSSQDATIEGFISTAREYAEDITGTKLPAQTITAFCDIFPTGREIKLPVGPAISVTSLKYTDINNVETEFSDFTLDTLSKFPRIVLNPDKDWPSGIELHPVNPIKIIYQAGHEASAQIKFRVKQAIFLLVGHWFEHREEVVTGVESYPMPVAAEILLQNVGRIET